MKMNKITTIILAAIAMLVASCTQDLSEAPHRIPVSLKADIGVPTRTSYEAVDGYLKTDWAVNDTVSVITMLKTDEGERIAAIDNLVNTAGAGNAAVFEGTLTPFSEDVRRFVVYPSFKYDGIDDGKIWYKKRFRDISGFNEYTFMKCYIGDDHFVMSSMNMPTYPDSFHFLAHTDLMTGVLREGSDGSYSTVLKKQMSLHALEISLSDEFIQDFFEYKENNMGWNNLDIFLEMPGNQFTDGMFYYENVRFGEDGDVQFAVETYYPEEEYKFFEPCSEIWYQVENPSELPATFTLYKPILGGAKIKAGTTLTISLDERSFHYRKELVVTSDKVIEPGYIYTYRADFR